MTAHGAVADSPPQHAVFVPPPTSTGRTRPPIALFGIPFDNVTLGETVRIMDRMIASRRFHYVVTANVDFLVQARKDVELRRILLDAHLVLCDGTPLLWASRLLGNPLPERVAGADLVPHLLSLAERRQYKVFFLGGSPDTAEAARLNIMRMHPRLPEPAFFAPPFRPLLEMDHDEIIRRIRDAAPDILLVSFGCPKQEKWISMHFRTLGVPLAIGVGGTIDFLAGRLRRAPLWMQRTGTEWIYRTLQEPRRLAGRYASDLFHFTAMTLSHALRAVIFPSHCDRFEQPELAGHGDYARLTLPSHFTAPVIKSHDALQVEKLEAPGHFVIDASRVQKIDSTGVGCLVRWEKFFRNRNRKFILLNPSVSVYRSLTWMHLLHFFDIAADMREAERILEDSESAFPLVACSGPREPVHWMGDITAVNREAIWKLTEKQIQQQGSFCGEIIIDLSQVRFIDSSGIGVMVRARKYASDRGWRLRFVRAKPAVCEVLRIAKLETALLQSPA